MTRDEGRNRIEDQRIYDNKAPVASISNNEHSKLLPWLMLCAILSGASIVLSGVCGVAVYLNYQETRQLQIQVMDHNALLIREGLAQPTDEVYGPAGNLEYKPHLPKRK